MILLERHKDWSKRSKEWMQREEHQRCECCGQQSQVVHHVEPVHARPDLEMIEENWAAVCHRCHFVVGHACDWRAWVSGFREISRGIRDTIRGKRAAMPQPTSLTDAIALIEAQAKTIQDQEIRIAVLEAEAKHSVGGSLSKAITEKVLLAIVAGAVTIFSGATFFKSRENASRVEEVQRTADDVAKRVDEVGSGVDDVKREVKRKGPFGGTP